jgi:murein DD-endopeptidase MepM/ murein hydrolase activator NlpD
MTKFLSFWKNNRFGVVSWLVTVAVVASLLGGAFWFKNAQAANSALVPQPTAGPDEAAPNVSLPLPPVSGSESVIDRQLQIITYIPAELPRYEPVTYIVQRGDAMSKIAESFKIETASILYNNKDGLEDNPHNLKPGMDLIIPPVDGIYYTWKEGDTLEKVAGDFHATVDDILNFPGNDVDLTNPDFKPGTLVMIPGGSRALIDWTQFVPTITRGSGTGTSEIGGSGCGGGAVGDGVFGWPTNGPHTISGNNYGAGHLAIDISATEGTPVFAADAGVVSEASIGDNYGYGNVVMIDHGHGYVTVYAHLSQINVTVCESVGQGTLIGLAGNTGNSFGAHLHFEIRLGGANVNPLDYVQ